MTNTMRNLVIPMAFVALLSACGSGGDSASTAEVTPCNCHLALEKNNQELASIIESCKIELKKEAFGQEYARCKIADMQGVSVDEVPAPTPKEKLELSAVSTGNYAVQLDNAKATWTGTKASGDKHYGTVGVKEGSVAIDGATVTAARVVFDMNAIANRDIEDEEKRAQLIGHLMSADFFDVANHPEAVWELTEPGTLTDNRGDLVGELTVRGTTQPLTIRGATIADLGKFVAMTGAVNFDRTAYGVSFGSSSAGAAADQAINDEVTINFTLTATPSEEVQ